MSLLSRNLTLSCRSSAVGVVQLLRNGLFTRSDKSADVVARNRGFMARMFGKNESSTAAEQASETPAKQGLISRIFFRKRKQNRKSWFKLGVVAGGGSVLGLMYSIRKYRDSLVMDLRPVHPDQSVVSISSAQPQVVPTVQIVTSTSSASIVDEDQYSEFVKTSVETLMRAQREMEEEASR